MSLLAVGIVYACTFVSPAWATERFGVETFGSSIESQAHEPVVQAGTHPYALTTTVIFAHEITREKESYKKNLNNEKVPLEEPEVFTHIYGNPKDIAVNLPTGLVVNPAATAVRCTEAQLETSPGAGGSCPAAAAVGVGTVYVSGLGEKVKGAIYNMAPPPGVPAELGIDPGGVGLIVHIEGRVRTGGDNDFSASVSEIGQTVSIYGLRLTLWGDPSEISHDAQRGVCASRGSVQKAIEKEFWENEISEDGASTKEYRFSCPTERTEAPLLTMPGACTGKPLETTVSVNSWQEPGEIEPPPALSPAMTGCEALSFAPTLEVTPAPEPTAAAESPTGLDVDLKIPHEESAGAPAEADLRQMSLTLPPGMAISLSAADGLGACTNAPEPERPEGEIALHSTAAARCPESSKIGEAEVVTPLLQEPLKGAVYMAQQGTFEEALIGLYVVVEGSGVQIKLAGRATLDPNTGQVTIVFAEVPQLPVSEIRLGLFGGQRAALVAPPGCGAYTVTSQLTPWSSPTPATPSGEFTVGSNCAQGFDPSFIAGTTDNRAGASGPFSITVTRRDGEQRLSSVRVVAPPGLVGVLKGVARCPEPQASAGACPGSSEVGEATIAAGPGADPVWLKGRIYLTGPYAGAPFGLSIALPAAAGPFDLGQAVVRARVEVDSHTAQMIISSDPLPSILRGVPLDIRTVSMTIGRAGFTLNPTNCAPLAVTGTISSIDGANVAVSNPFEAVDCASLPFAPKLTASTQAHTSRSRGASLSVKIAAGTGQANIGKVRVILPSQLPGRLATLQHACTAAVFDADPASCPAASIVGEATVNTPLLAQPLTGPAYLLARGGAAYPDVAIVLQGEGVVEYLDGNMDIKNGLISATFNSIPSMPIGTFTVMFPEGPRSILGTDLPAKARGSMCGQPLTMPTALTAQNGAVVAQATKVAVTGCPKRVEARSRRRGRARARKQRRGR